MGASTSSTWPPSMSIRDRVQASRRLATGTHIPHPRIASRRSRHETFTFDRPMGLWLDGVERGNRTLAHRQRRPRRGRDPHRRNVMDAWILDESPGSYRWGTIDLPALRRDDVQIRVVTSALNHMDLWVTRGMPKPPLPHVPGCDVAGVVEAVGDGRHQVSRSATRWSSILASLRSPTSSPSATTVRWGRDSRSMASTRGAGTPPTRWLRSATCSAARSGVRGRSARPIRWRR